MLPTPAYFFPEFPAADQEHHCAGIGIALRRVLESGRFILGDEVQAFETEFATYLGAAHVVGVGSGTDAIELMLRALQIGPGEAVALPALAPSACAAAVCRTGAEPVLVDVDAGTLTLCPRALESILKARRVCAVFAVHLYGRPVAWEALHAVCAAQGVPLLEDCAQAHGASLDGRKVGTLGVAAAWSFYPTKNLGALGDAGAVSTQDAVLAERLRLLREYGWRQRQVSAERGINSRLDELQAAVLRVKLPGLDAAVLRRRELAAMYAQRLGEATLAHAGHAFHLWVMRSGQREALLRHLKVCGVPAAVHYPVALHKQAAFACAGSFPNAERAAREVLSLPLHPYLSDEAVRAVCAAVEGFRG